MKKGIKSLMLIAAAAMTFASCQKEEKVSVNGDKDGKMVNFTSVIDGTKTAFGEQVGGKYPTLWTGDEKVGVVYADADITYNKDKESDNVVGVKGSGATTTFSATLAEPSSATGTIYVFAPWYYGSYSDAAAGGFTRYAGKSNKANVVIPTTQVSTPTSCDPRAQLLVAKYDFTNGVEDNVNVDFTHATAYGKVTISGVAAKIKTVKIDFGQNVTGTGLYYYTADNEKYSAKAGDLKAGTSYNKTYVELDNSSYGCDKTFWFGIPATSCEGKTVVVTVTDENDKVYSKVIDSESSTGKYLAFEQGKVSAFTVNVTAASEEKQYITVKDLREKGVTTIAEQLYMKAIVISNAEGGNSTSKRNIVVSDGNAGIAVRFSADASFAVGTELEFNLMGAKLSLYNNCLQINGIENANVEATGEVRVLAPVSITAADLVSGKYESMYVVVPDVQVVNEDLEKNVGGSSHTSINMEAKTGEKFVMFTASYATFKGDRVPQGSGALKGIANINGTTYQIVPTVASDYAGLTGPRFGDAPAFEFGTPVFSATTMKQGAAIEGGKITIPYSNATGEESYIISVSVSGEAADGIIDVVNLIRSIQVSGSGNLEIPINGTPQYAGSVKFTISGIDGLTTTEVTATVASATETSKKITVDELEIPAQGDASWKTAAYSKTVGDFTVSIDAKGATAKPSYNSTNKNVRLYAANGTTLSIASTKVITKVVFNAKINKKSGKATTVTSNPTGFDVSTMTWSGSSNKVDIIVGGEGEAGNFEVVDFTIYY